MREIKHIVVHCSGGTQDATVDAIKKYWKKIGWKNVGYHFIIDKNGIETQLQSIVYPTNGVKGYNENSIHICYIGGVDKFGKPVDNRTDAQKGKLRIRIHDLITKFPKAMVLGHRDLSPDKDKDGVVEKHEWVKYCPCFDVKTEL
jgi:N-acetylmuramoyl-L-alanine amidase